MGRGALLGRGEARGQAGQAGAGRASKPFHRKFPEEGQRGLAKVSPPAGSLALGQWEAGIPSYIQCILQPGAAAGAVEAPTLVLSPSQPVRKALLRLEFYLVLKAALGWSQGAWPPPTSRPTLHPPGKVTPPGLCCLPLLSSPSISCTQQLTPRQKSSAIPN